MRVHVLKGMCAFARVVPVATPLEDGSSMPHVTASSVLAAYARFAKLARNIGQASHSRAKLVTVYARHRSRQMCILLSKLASGGLHGLLWGRISHQVSDERDEHALSMLVLIR